MNYKNKINCPLCGSLKVNKFWAMAGYRLARCAECTMVWEPLFDQDYTSQYNQSYFVNENPKGGYSNYFEGMSINKKTFRDRLKKIEHKHGKGKLLDVGCALGDCLSVAKSVGWKEVKGVEVSNYAYRIAREKGLDVTQGTLVDIKEKDFDIICYQDVIEHVEDPIKELTTARKKLRKGGIALLVTPDIGGWWSRILGPLWYHYKPKEHILYFNQQTIKLALEKAGFKNISTKRTYHIMSVEYIFNRLRYYAPYFFEGLLKITRKTPIKNFSFKVYTGELEAWGENG